MNTNEQIQDFDNLINAFIKVGDKMKGVKINEREQYFYNAEGLGKKILHHILASRFLLNGYNLNGYEKEIDFASIAILTRAALETYLTLHYIFIAPLDDDEKEFNLQVWQLGGLDRIKYKPVYEGNEEKWEKEVELAKGIISRIKATQCFNQFEYKRQKRILNGEWKLKGWDQIAISAGFNQNYFKKIYLFLSSYAHSNRLSVIQIQQIKEFEKQKEMALAFISMSATILGKYTYDYIHLMPGLKEKIDLNSDEYKVVLEYKRIGEMLD